MKNKKIPIIIGTMETGRLSNAFGPGSEMFYSKKGGLGDVIPVLSAGLINRGADVHIVMPNLKTQFMRENGVTKKEWVAKRHKVAPKNIHLIDSHYIGHLPHVYAGDTTLTAAIFQSKAASIIKTIRSQADGQGIYISNDWMTCGYLSAYLATRGTPILHMIHSVHTGYIKISDYYDTPMSDFRHNFYFKHGESDVIDSHATGIKNATYVGVVGNAFLHEILHDRFPEMVPPSVLGELRAKYVHGQTLFLPNGLYENMLPENQADIFKKFQGKYFTTETEDLVSAKKKNKLAFQKILKLNEDPDACLFFWPSRVDSFQKGIHLLEEIAIKFVRKHKNAQIAIVADPTNDRENHKEILTDISLDSSGQVCYYGFEKDLSNFGYSAADFILSAPSFEPYGFFIPQGLAAGSMIIVTNTGGGRDMVVDYKTDKLMGNGVHLKNHSSEALFEAMEKALKIHDFFLKKPEIYNNEIRRFMTEARKNQGSEKMIDGYMNILEIINGNKPIC
ncbi:MAG: glycogen/starch synthase [Candidatus Delongbacteria bacterium]|nr:glycogen/starch synthase [Candidatus Delongbacteria bacterium]MBN2835049.1 glycogen/starch synthase [Candidatus Delongbacteria bacterium]